MQTDLFNSQKPIPQKLIYFGFAKTENGDYVYHTNIVNNQFLLFVTVKADGKVYTKLMDSDTNDEYVLHTNPTVTGSFVGSVRLEYDNVLSKICKKCFELDVFKSAQAKDVIAFVKETYGCELEFLWPKFSMNAVFRRSDTKKWYAALLTVGKDKLGLNTTEPVEILDIRINRESLESLLKIKGMYPAYHMNKKSWITIILDGSVRTDEIFNMIKTSYALAKK